MASHSSSNPAPATWILLLIVMVPQLGLTLINPANATIAGELNTSVSTVELTLTVYMIGYATSMFISGTLADRFDASRLQSLGLGLFALGSIIAATSPTITVLAIGRFFQAFGGTSATVLCRIIVQRRYPSDLRLGILTSMSMIISLTPSFSPLLGGILAEVLPWRVMFLILAIFSLALIPMIEFLLGKAHPERPGLPSASEFSAAIAQSLHNADYRWYAIAISLVWMTYFGFVSASTTILQEFLGQSAVTYGVLMAISAIGYLTGSILVKRATDVPYAVGLGAGLGTIGIIATGVTTATGWINQPLVVAVVMSVVFLGVGATIPYTQAGLLELDLDYPGVAAGLFFFIQMAGGAAFSAFLGAVSLSSVAAYMLVLMVPQIIVTLMIARARRKNSLH